MNVLDRIRRRLLRQMSGIWRAIPLHAIPLHDHDDVRAAVREAIAELRTDIEKVVRAEVNRAIAAMHEVERRDRSDLYAAGQREAALSSARFARVHMPTARVFFSPADTLAYALSRAPSHGMALEFGVYTGGTLAVIAQARGGIDVYGFDSFDGLPEDWRSVVRKGDFRVEELPSVPGAELVVGMFADTLPGFLTEHPDPVAFVHLDADLYSSTNTVLQHIEPRLVPGTVILFDEYFNYAGWEDHEHRAWQEFLATSRIQVRYEAYTVNHQQVMVQVTAV